MRRGYCGTHGSIQNVHPWVGSLEFLAMLRGECQGERERYGVAPLPRYFRRRFHARRGKRSQHRHGLDGRLQRIAAKLPVRSNKIFAADERAVFVNPARIVVFEKRTRETKSEVGFRAGLGLLSGPGFPAFEIRIRQAGRREPCLPIGESRKNPPPIGLRQMLHQPKQPVSLGGSHGRRLNAAARRTTARAGHGPAVRLGANRYQLVVERSQRGQHFIQTGHRRQRFDIDRNRPSQHPQLQGCLFHAVRL